MFFSPEAFSRAHDQIEQIVQPQRCRHLYHTIAVEPDGYRRSGLGPEFHCMGGAFSRRDL